MTDEAEIKAEPNEEEKDVEKKPVIKTDVEEDSMEDEDEEEETPAEINLKRESHAPQVDINQLSKEPDFAIVCSFFNKFGAMIGMKPLSFTKLESLLTSFEADGHVNKELMDIHLMLMRRIRMLSVRAENWENYLKKFLALNETTEEQLLQVERYGYVNLPVSSKVQILKALCDAQFDYNPKMKENMTTTCRANNLRLIPLGMDKNGLIYWYQQDSEFNIRIYTEEPDDQSGVTWTLVVKTPEELDTLISRLKNEDLGYKKKESDGKEKEKEKEPLNADPQAQMLMSTKRGTFVDLYLDDAAIKRMREFLVKQKEERRNKREGKIQKEAEEKEEEEVEEEDTQEEDLDKRIMPRRSAASKAVTNMRKFVTPSSKRGPRKKKAEGEEGDDEEKEGEDSKDGKKDGSEETASDEEDEDEDEGDFTDEESEDDDDDDEFKPKSEKPKRKRIKRGPKKKKQVVDEEDEDESDEEEIQKERKVATGDSACGQCKKSCDWDVLLLCDVCDDAWHTYCLKPMLWFVPDGDWFCPKCVHGMLIEKMEEVAKVLDENLKKKAVEEKKKKAAADRLRREMEYIGVSLNNIIPTTFKETAIPSSSSSSDEDTTQRKSKRQAVKKIAPRSRFQMEVMQTIAEGRSRRRTQRVDYKFTEYDDAIQDACDELGEERPPSRHGEVVRPSGGAGRGKDMANIIEAERRTSVDENGQPVERQIGKPAKSRKKLNDLDVDNLEESDSEEYQANESEEEAADEEENMSGSEYIPSDEERRRTRRSGGRRVLGFDGPTQSDEDFVVSDSDGSYGYRSGKGQKKKKEPKKKKAKWASDDETSEEEEASDDDDYYSDDSRDAKKKKAKKAAKPAPKRRWTAREESEEEEEEEEEQYEESDEDAPRTQSGRPMRKAVAAKPKATVSDEEDEEEEEVKKKEERPVGALDRIRKQGSDSEGEFKPDEEDEEEEDEDEEEEDEEEVMKKAGKKRKISDSDDSEEEEEEVDDSKRLAPRPPKMAKPSPLKKTPVKAPERSTASEPPKETKSVIKPVEVETKPLVKTNGASKAPEPPRQITVNVKQEPTTSETPSPRGVQREMKPLTVQASPHGPPSKPTPPISHGIGPPPGPYASPHGAYPPHPGYYQGGPPPMMAPHPGMPPYSGPPGYANPYGPPPNWQGGPYGPSPPQVHNPYAPAVHNPYGHPPPTSSANTYNDLQSL